MKFNVTAVSINRETREQSVPPRVELIDTGTNELFKDDVTALDIEVSYEAFWNDLNTRSVDIVKVINVVALRDWEEWTYEAAQALGLDQKALQLETQRELTLRAAKQIADKSAEARNPDSGGLVF